MTKKESRDSIVNWNRFAQEALIVDGETNVKLDFKALTRKYGLSYIEYCQAAWQANDNCLTEEEFCRINGNIPKGFFEKKIKKCWPLKL